MAKVAIFGAGVGGLTVAHELVRRGYQVEVYERSSAYGGKSRSHFPGGLPAPVGDRKPMPGEHGFRFFPGFYRHLIDVLEGIPGVGSSVAQDLVVTPEAGLAFSNEGLIKFQRHPGRGQSMADVFTELTNLYSELQFSNEDLKRMAWFRLKYLTSCRKRRVEEYEKMPWTDFVDSNSTRYTERFREFDKAIPRTMSALVAEITSAKVIGDISMQFLLGVGRNWEHGDRLLQGPSSEIWIDKWVKYLNGEGVKFFPNERLVRLDLDLANQIERCVVTTSSGTKFVDDAEHYVLAVPVNDLRPLVRPALVAVDPMLRKIDDVPEGKLDGWMVGAQVYLKQDVPMVRGHMFYPDSEWAITSISQGQFWGAAGGRIADRYGDGSISGILSIIVSDWDRLSLSTGRSARQTLVDLGPDAVVNEALNQITTGLGPGAQDLTPGNIAGTYLDEGVSVQGGAAVNATPLLLHPVDGLKDRPKAFSDVIGNLYLASDYVCTCTQLASMESACEAGKRAVNKILERDGSLHYPCDIVDLQEELIFEPAKRLDEIRLAHDRSHIMDAFPFSLLLDAPDLTPLMSYLLSDPLDVLEFL